MMQTLRVSTADLSYRPQLDALRALAVICVLYSHFFSDGFLGPLGVRVFFVLSGLLITKILLTERDAIESGKATRQSVLCSFYMRRILRIFPAYYLAIFVASVAYRPMRDFVWWHALFGSNILFAKYDAYVPPFSAHLWSLSVEEQFYLLWPALLLFVPAKHTRTAICATIAFSVTSKLILWQVGVSPFVRWFSPTSSLDALATGALLATGLSLNPAIVRTSALGIAAGVLAQSAIASDGHESWPSIVLDALLLVPIAGLVAGAHQGFAGSLGAMLSTRPLIYIGRISYGIYLYHLFVMAGLLLIAHKLSLPLRQFSATMMVFGTVATLIVAAASWRFLEKPINSLKRFFPAQAPS